MAWTHWKLSGSACQWSGLGTFECRESRYKSNLMITVMCKCLRFMCNVCAEETSCLERLNALSCSRHDYFRKLTLLSQMHSLSIIVSKGQSIAKLYLHFSMQMFHCKFHLYCADKKLMSSCCFQGIDVYFSLPFPWILLAREHQISSLWTFWTPFRYPLCLLHPEIFNDTLKKSVLLLQGLNSLDCWVSCIFCRNSFIDWKLWLM